MHDLGAPGEGRGLELLARDECLRLLANHHFGRLAFATPDALEVLPVNYAYDRTDVIVRTHDGSRLARGVPGRAVALEIDEIDPVYHAGWSVVVHGTGAAVHGAAEIDRLRRLPLEPWVGGRHDCWLRIPATEVSGRRVVHPGAGGRGVNG